MVLSSFQFRAVFDVLYFPTQLTHIDPLGGLVYALRIRIFVLFILNFMLRFYFCCQNEKILCCIFVLFILDFMLRFYFCCQNENILCCIYCRWKRQDLQQGNYYLNGKVKTSYIPIYNSPPSLETTFALQTFRVFEGV